MNSLECVKKKIATAIALSDVPEDPVHSKNVLKWVLRLDPKADTSLQIAALGHDIERAIKKRKVRRQDYKNYDQFKQAHAVNSAVILKKIMAECRLNKKTIEEVYWLIQHHETGGNKKADLLKNADALSFFEVNLPLYYSRNTEEETKKRCLWGLKKLPDELIKIAANFHYDDKNLTSLLQSCIRQSTHTSLSTR